MMNFIAEYWLFFIAVAGAGVLGGLLAGLLGVGGGIVIVPVLFVIFTILDYASGLAMKLAVATSLATIVLTSLMSARSHYKRGATDIALLKAWFIPIVVGVLIGTFIGGFADGRILTLVFAVVAVLVALKMMIPQKESSLASGFPNASIQAASGVGVGLISAMMGIGGGTLSVPLLTAVGYEMRRAVGTSAAIGFVIAVPATIGYMLAGQGVADLAPLSIGYVNVPAFVALVPLTMIFAPVGARIAHSIPQRALQSAFGLFLLLTAARMFYSVWS
ncbi:sulfite exporter TauE/SafE family protein [Cohaesibacter celericrescens]|nr:sulfite exporter TauE/SafE family protein [Cohaesibacter celericrescens]